MDRRGGRGQAVGRGQPCNFGVFFVFFFVVVVVVVVFTVMCNNSIM